MSFLLQHHGVDLSDGFGSIVTVNDYYRAQDQNGSNPLKARIGDNGDSDDWPAVNASGISGNPSLDYGATSYLSLTHLAARQAADPNAVYSVVMPFRRTQATTGYPFGFGDPTVNNVRHGFFVTGAGVVGFASVTSGGVVKDNLAGSGSVPVDTDGILALTYRGTSGCEARTLIGGVETVRLSKVSAAALDPGDFPITDCHLGDICQLTPQPFRGRIGGAVVILAELSSGEFTDVLNNYNNLYPV